ncbi:MAG: MBL fold metallo-hydrolase [Bacteroides sp.]|nr:MBL fold metallo-hydrolase [Bacteroides sp.]MCM1548729.1 MBL fold metallo-hydrolase [Clostridium sp.]
MKLTMLGTGNATVTECFNTCFVFSNEEDMHFLVDTGGGNRILKVLKDCNISLEGIHDIFLTHEHIDHLLGIFWLIRMIGTKMNQGTYQGTLSIYCHSELIDKICAMAEMMIQKKVCRHIGRDILFIAIDNGEQMKILDSDVTFFDIYSTKATQFGFTMVTKDGIKLACLGDEPYNPKNEGFVRDSDWMMHEAFCLFREAEQFAPYEKHHSTVKEACEAASRLGAANLILYHTEETHLENRKELYTEEGRQYYSGNLYVPDDKECFEISRSLRFMNT